MSTKPYRQLDHIFHLIKTPRLFVAALVLFVVLLYVIPNSFISPGLGNTILTISTFLFGLIAGFYIVVTTTDYNTLKNLIGQETAGLIELHGLVAQYDPAAANTLEKLIDTYLRRAFDYEIIDYPRETIYEFNEVREFVQKLPFKERLSSLYQEISSSLREIIGARQQLIVLGTKTLSGFQWMILFILAALVIASLYGLRTGEVFFDIVTVLIASSIILILLLIRELDLYIWNEQTFGYHVYQNVFHSIGELPYYPLESIQKGRIIPHESEYRVGIYIDFPKSIRRKIETRKV